MIKVLHTAPQLTIQDTGRHGLRHLGVPGCGALDADALRRANLLLGNLSQAAALEVAAGPLTLESQGAHHIVLMGADMQARLRLSDSDTEQRVIPGFICEFPPGAVLTLTRTAVPGQRALIAFAGGIDVPRVLGSRSTDLANRFGGFEGRALRAGDQLPIKEHDALPVLSVGVRQRASNAVLRAIRSLDYDGFRAAAQSAFWHSAWRVAPASNRMGLRLQGPALSSPAAAHRLSSGVLPGVVQLPPDGQPIILAADAQTTGGYPVIASVIQADLWQLAYLPPGASIRFSEVSIAEAQGLQAAQLHERRLLALRLSRLRGRHAGADL